ncbi:MAG TPA: ABC transporter permease subunit [Firmicutes bacterium]|nr:ABC transporter permease subunit [Bacillota bacterium]
MLVSTRFLPVSAEFLKVRRLRATRVILAAMALAQVLVLMGITYSLSNPAQPQGPSPEILDQARLMTTFPTGIPVALSFAATLGPLFAIILSAHIVGCEYSWGTMRQLIATGQDRTRYIFIKTAGLLLASLMIAITSGVSGGAGLALTPLIGGMPPQPGAIMSPGFLLSLAKALGIAWFCLSFYSLLTLLFTTLARSTATGMAAGLLFFFLEGGLMGFLAHMIPAAKSIIPYTISYNITIIQSLLEGATHAGPVASNELLAGGTPIRAFAILLLYAAGFLRGAIEIARRQELS